METTVLVASIVSIALSLTAKKVHTAIVVLSNQLLTTALTAVTP